MDLDIDSGYGYIVQPYKKASILPIIFLITDRMKLVDIETLCQFTGLYDKNENKIWENDIVNRDGKLAPIKFGRYCSSFNYGNYNFGFYVDFPKKTFYRKELGYWCRKVETAGNVFDNPELLQEELDE